MISLQKGQLREDDTLERVAEVVSWHPDEPAVMQFFTMDAVFSLLCTSSPGHSTTVRIEGMANQVEFGAPFNAESRDHSLQDFHRYPLSIWYEDHPSLLGRNDELSYIA